MRLDPEELASDEQRPVHQSFCGSLRRNTHWKCFILTLLISGCLGAILWCRMSTHTSTSNLAYVSMSFMQANPCDDGYVYIPVAFVVMLYLVYLVECWHCHTRLDLKGWTDVNTVYEKIQSMKEALPIVWWRSVCYHYIRRTRQVTRYRNGDAFTTTQVYYERINSHTAASAYNFASAGVKDSSKNLIGLENHPATKIRFTKGFSFAAVESEQEFEDQRADFFIQNERRDDYMETKEGLDLLNVNFKDYTLAFADPDHLPWYVSHIVFWAASILLLSWPLRVLVEYKTCYVHYHIHKVFGINYLDPTYEAGQMTRTNTICSSELELTIRDNLAMVPSYSEALLIDCVKRGRDANGNITPGSSGITPTSLNGRIIYTGMVKSPSTRSQGIMLWSKSSTNIQNLDPQSSSLYDISGETQSAATSKLKNKTVKSAASQMSQLNSCAETPVTPVENGVVRDGSVANGVQTHESVERVYFKDHIPVSQSCHSANSTSGSIANWSLVKTRATSGSFPNDETITVSNRSKKSNRIKKKTKKRHSFTDDNANTGASDVSSADEKQHSRKQNRKRPDSIGRGSQVSTRSYFSESIPKQNSSGVLKHGDGIYHDGNSDHIQKVNEDGSSASIAQCKSIRSDREGTGDNTNALSDSVGSEHSGEYTMQMPQEILHQDRSEASGVCSILDDQNDATASHNTITQTSETKQSYTFHGSNNNLHRHTRDFNTNSKNLFLPINRSDQSSTKTTATERSSGRCIPNVSQTCSSNTENTEVPLTVVTRGTISSHKSERTTSNTETNSAETHASSRSRTHSIPSSSTSRKNSDFSIDLAAISPRRKSTLVGTSRTSAEIRDTQASPRTANNTNQQNSPKISRTGYSNVVPHFKSLPKVIQPPSEDHPPSYEAALNMRVPTQQNESQEETGGLFEIFETTL